MTGSTTIDENKSGASELLASEQQQNLIVERLASLFGDATQLDNVGNEMRLRCKVDDLLYVLKTVRDDPMLQFSCLLYTSPSPRDS